MPCSMAIGMLMDFPSTADHTEACAILEHFAWDGCKASFVYFYLWKDFLPKSLLKGAIKTNNEKKARQNFLFE